MYFRAMKLFGKRRTISSMLILVLLVPITGCSDGWESCSSLQAKMDKLSKSMTLLDEDTEGDLQWGSDEWDKAMYEEKKIAEKADEQGCIIYLN